MSRAKQEITKNKAFAGRFIEICGTGEPAKIQQLLNLPYQTVRNYIKGRLPRTEMLVLIANRTSCSIDWLLTGRGKKFLYGDVPRDTPLPAGQMETFVRKICVEVINEMQESHLTAPRRVVVLQSSELMSEKVADEPVTLSGGHRQ
jgi:hypothetical protein